MLGFRLGGSERRSERRLASEICGSPNRFGNCRWRLPCIHENALLRVGRLDNGRADDGSRPARGEIQGSSDRPIDVGIFPHMTAKQGAQRGQSEACPPLLPRNCRSSATSAPRTSRSTRWRDALLARSRSIAALPGVALLSRRRRHRSDQSSPPHSAKRRQSRQACRVGRQSGCCGSYGRHFCFGTACDRWRARRMPCDRQKQASRYDWSCNRASGPSAALRSGRSGRRARCAGRSCVGRLGGSR